MTESLFDLGFGFFLVGITDYCTRPADKVPKIQRVGGTKTARKEDILRLQPDLVIANQEENAKTLIEELAAQGIPVWVTFPCTVKSALEDLWSLVGIFQSDQAAIKLRTLENAIEYYQLSQADRSTSIRYFCPIWREKAADGGWWMTFNRETYSSDLLGLLGGENVFGSRQRKYPLDADLGKSAAEPAGERDTRYPRVTGKEILAAHPEVILLPDEPYSFTSADQAELVDLVSGSGLPVKTINLPGDLITWPGTRLGRALVELADLFN